MRDEDVHAIFDDFNTQAKEYTNLPSCSHKIVMGYVPCNKPPNVGIQFHLSHAASPKKRLKGSSTSSLNLLACIIMLKIIALQRLWDGITVRAIIHLRLSDNHGSKGSMSISIAKVRDSIFRFWRIRKDELHLQQPGWLASVNCQLGWFC